MGLKRPGLVAPSRQQTSNAYVTHLLPIKMFGFLSSSSNKGNRVRLRVQTHPFANVAMRSSGNDAASNGYVVHDLNDDDSILSQYVMPASPLVDSSTTKSSPSSSAPMREGSKQHPKTLGPDPPFLVDCEVCKSTGFVPCSKCGAEGFIRNARSGNAFYCPDCVGHKKLRCPSCGGKCYMC